MLTMMQLGSDVQAIPWTHEQNQTMLNLDYPFLTVKEIDDAVALIDSPILKIFWSRLRGRHVFPSPYVLALVEETSAGRPGRAVLWAYTIFKIAQSDSPYVFSSTLYRALNRQVPSENGWSRLWQSQKLEDGQNALDVRPWS